MAANANSKNHGKNDDHSPTSGSKEFFPLFRQAGTLSPYDKATDKHFVAIMAFITAIGIITPIIMGGGFGALTNLMSAEVELPHISFNNPTSTATPQAIKAPSDNSGHDPVLVAMAARMKGDAQQAINKMDLSFNKLIGDPTIKWGNATNPEDADFTINIQWGESNGVVNSMLVGVSNCHTVSNATALYNERVNLVGTSGPAVDDHAETHIFYDSAAAVLGHQPATVRDISYHVDNQPAGAYELIQYDNLVLRISQSHNGAPAAPSSVTP
jgi:hypothetical protein